MFNVAGIYSLLFFPICPMIFEHSNLVGSFKFMTREKDTYQNVVDLCAKIGELRKTFSSC